MSISARTKEMKEFVDAAHARGIKVYLDIITNHTADVISYRQCPNSDCVYRSRADYPYSRAGGTDGSPINEGFMGDSVQTEANFARLVRSDYAYEPFVPAAEAKVKVPAWLNDPLWYHNRGNTTFRGETSMMGDFVGLDDLMTENPRVLQGFIEIYGQWIEALGIDGFRIDTARHVNPEFWQSFAPAMQAKARARGIPNFHIFGEVFDRNRRHDHAGAGDSHRSTADRVGFRVPCRDRRNSDQGRGTGQAGGLCSTAMRCTKAARPRRCSCRHLSAIMTSAALGITRARI